MPRIEYYAQNFGSYWGSSLQGWNYLDVTWSDIVWSAVSVGKTGYGDLIAHGQFSLDDIRFREFMIYAHLMQFGPHIERSPLYETIDPTEKGSISYFVGMMSAKLVALFLFDVPWLVHLEKIRAYYPIGLIARSRPDLIGMNRNFDWVVIEAKGRTNSFSRKAIQKAKAQTRQLRAIAGQFPVLRCASESYFSPDLRIHVEDPEDYDDEAVDIEIRRHHVLDTYYRAFLFLEKIAQSKETVGNETYLVYDDESLGISMGVNLRILDLTKSDYADLDQFRYLFKLPQGSHIIGNREYKFYPDGIIISVDKRWADDTMRLDPRKRPHEPT